MTRRFTSTALMLGNFVTGVSIIGPAGMLNELSADLAVGIATAGALVTFGAIVLCFGSPLMAWATSRMDRRTLLISVMAVMTLGHAASAFAPDYTSLLALRLILLIVAAVYTPQGASTVALIVPEEKRASSIAYVFVGWSMAVAFGLPLVTLIADTLGWRFAYGGLAAVGVVVGILLMLTLPKGLRGSPLSLASWSTVFRNGYILLLLLNTAFRTGGQFVIVTYLAPLLVKRLDAGSATIGTFFALFGVAGIVGNLTASAVVNSWGSYRTSMICGALMVIGAIFWIAGPNNLPAMAAGFVFVGLGFASSNSMQQARLVSAAPALAAASVALNTSAIYVGQAIGSALGGFLFVRGALTGMDIAQLLFYLAAIGVQFLTRPSAARVEK
jgi:predicted MFS family arabinose efflux permease